MQKCAVFQNCNKEQGSLESKYERCSFFLSFPVALPAILGSFFPFRQCSGYSFGELSISNMVRLPFANRFVSPVLLDAVSGPCRQADLLLHKLGTSEDILGSVKGVADVKGGARSFRSRSAKACVPDERDLGENQ